MLNKEFRQIKIEEKDDRLNQISQLLSHDKPIKIQFDPRQYPPIRWAPLRSQDNHVQARETLNTSEQQNNLKWIKIMKKILSRLLSTYISEKQFANFTIRFKKWRHSTTFIFAILMYVYHRLSRQKNHFCDSYRTKIQNLQNLDPKDADLLGDSINIVLEFFIGKPILAIEQFYRKFRNESNYDQFNGKKFIKKLQKAISEKEQLNQIQNFTSAQLYQDEQNNNNHEESQMMIQSKDQNGQSSNGNLNVSNNKSQSNKTRRKVRNGDTFLIYRKDDSSKGSLYPKDMNYKVKNAFHDLFPV